MSLPRRTVPKLYKLDEYPETLPNPRLLPIEEKIVTAIEGHPDTFTNGFIMDLSVIEEDRQRLEKKVIRTIRTVGGRIDDLLEKAKEATILLSEPQYIHAGIDYLTYVLFAPDIKPTGIQVKYYRYFRNRYPNCKFYTDGKIVSPKAVKVNDRLVGLWMPIILPPMEIKDG